MRDIWELGGCNGTWNYNHLVGQRTLNHSVRLRTKWLWARVPLQSLKTAHMSMMIQEFKSSKNRAQLMSGLANLTKKQSELSAKQYQHHLCLKKKRIGSFFDIFDKRGSLKKYLKFKQVGWAGESLLRWVFVTKTTNQRYFKKKQLWNCQSLLFLPKLPISLISKTCSKKLQKTGDITRFLFCIRYVYVTLRV